MNTNSMTKPRLLKIGDRIAAVSLSWGGPASFPARYEIGKQQFREQFGLEVVETPHALANSEWLAKNPQARADDLMQAFADESIAGIVCTIGGDDSIRTLRYIDHDVIKANPKPFIGYSDSTVTHMACMKAGLVSFYGPALMAGFAENSGMHGYLIDSFRKTLMSAEPVGVVEPNTEGWTVEFLEWGDPENQATARKLNPCSGWKFLQGSGLRRGCLIGGCFECFEWFRGTDLWPSQAQWDGAILFLETSEEGIAPTAISRALRVYAAMGILEKLSGILFGRPGGQIARDGFDEYDQAILQVVRDEQGLVELPIVSHMDFGHTDPIMILPLGVQAEIDCVSERFSILENAVVE